MITENLAIRIATDVFSLPVLVLILMGLSVLLWYRGNVGSVVAIGVTAVAFMISVDVLKNGLEVPRPTGARVKLTGYGWPSGHAAGVLYLVPVVWSVLQPLIRGWYRYALAFTLAGLSFLVGWSRLYLGVHTVDQVIAGFGVGLLWGLVFVWVHYKERRLGI